MIISHKYKYVFVELPRTASTAISRELRQHYGGAAILRKHATYLDFLRIAGAEEKDFFSFSCIRNPLSDAVSLYFKLKTDHKRAFSDPRNRGEMSGSLYRWYVGTRFDFTHRTGADFSTYFIRFHRTPYSNWSSLSHRDLDFIIRFENLQQDFARVLELLGIEQKRPLPIVNKTGEKGDDFSSHYTPEAIEHAKRVYGPFMKEWGYEFPSEWGDVSVSRLTQFQYQFLNVFRRFYWKYLRGYI